MSFGGRIMAVRIEMNMPENCYECSFCSAVDIKEWNCRLTEITFPKKYGEGSRLKYCPLKEVKE